MITLIIEIKRKNKFLGRCLKMGNDEIVPRWFGKRRDAHMYIYKCDVKVSGIYEIKQNGK